MGNRSARQLMGAISPLDGDMATFVATFSEEAACERALLEARFPGGYRCPRCGGESYSMMRSRRHTCQCTRCRKQVSPTADTAMQGTKLPLSKWFLSIRLATHSKRGVSAAELARELGVCEKTGQYVLRRLRGAMSRSECLPGARRRG